MKVHTRMKNIIIASCLLLGLNLNLDLTKGNFSVTGLPMQAQGQNIPQFFQPAVWIVSSSGASSGISTIGAMMMTDWQNHINNIWSLGGVVFTPTLGGGLPTGGVNTTEPEGLFVNGSRKVIICGLGFEVNFVMPNTGPGPGRYVICVQELREKITYVDSNGDKQTVEWSHSAPIYAYVPNMKTNGDTLVESEARIAVRNAYEKVIESQAKFIHTCLHATHSSATFEHALQTDGNTELTSLVIPIAFFDNQPLTHYPVPSANDCEDAVYDGEDDCQ